MMGLGAFILPIQEFNIIYHQKSEMMGVSQEEKQLQKQLLRIDQEDNDKTFICYDPIRVPMFQSSIFEDDIKPSVKLKTQEIKPKKLLPLMAIENTRKVLKQSLKKLDVQSTDKYFSIENKPKRSRTRYSTEATKLRLDKHQSVEKMRPLVLVDEEKRTEMKYRHLHDDQLIRLMIKRKLVEKERIKRCEKMDKENQLVKNRSQHQKLRKNLPLRNRFKLPHIL